MISNMPEYKTFELKCEGCNKTSCYLKTTKEEYDELYPTLCTTIFCISCILGESAICSYCDSDINLLYRVDAIDGYIDFCSKKCAEEYVSRNAEDFVYEID